MLGLFESQYFSDNDQHHCDVGRDAHELVCADHDDVDCDDGKLWEFVFDDLFDPDDGRGVDLLFDAISDHRGFLTLRLSNLFLPIILVIHQLVGWLLHNRTRVVRILQLQTDLVLSLPLIRLFGEFYDFYD